MRNAAKPIFKNTQSQTVVRSCEFTNDQRHIISTTEGGVLHVTSIETQQQMVKHHEFGHAKSADTSAMHCCRSIKGHPYGNVFLCGGENMNVCMLQFDPKQPFESLYLEAMGTYQGHSDAIRAAEHNKEGDLMLSACADHSLRLWDLKNKRCMSLFAGHTGLVVSLA